MTIVRNFPHLTSVLRETVLSSGTTNGPMSLQNLMVMVR
jgi:hypothetical protein